MQYLTPTIGAAAVLATLLGITWANRRERNVWLRDKKDKLYPRIEKAVQDWQAVARGAKSWRRAPSFEPLLNEVLRLPVRHRVRFHMQDFNRLTTRASERAAAGTDLGHTIGAIQFIGDLLIEDLRKDLQSHAEVLTLSEAIARPLIRVKKRITRQL